MDFFNKLFGNKEPKEDKRDIEKSSIHQEYERGLQMLNNSDVKIVHKGYNIIGPIAANGYAEAQVTMGMFVEENLGDLSQAVVWYKRAAEQGHPKGQWCLANMLMTGRGTGRNINLAMQYYELAAKQGVAEAQFVMGEHYRNNGNREVAYSWYKKAVENGYTNASIRIQQMDSGQR